MDERYAIVTKKTYAGGDCWIDALPSKPEQSDVVFTPKVSERAWQTLKSLQWGPEWGFPLKLIIKYCDIPELKDEFIQIAGTAELIEEKVSTD